MLGFFRKAAAISFIFLTALAGGAAPAQAWPAQGDYDFNGHSDLAVALVDRQARSTAWLVRLTDKNSSLFWTFNVPGDALITGKFYTDNKVYPGVVYVSDARVPLNWYIKTPNGGETYLQYGLPGDTIPNMADMDGDGITDLIAVRNGSGSTAGYRVWYIALSSKPGVVAQEIFGLTSDRVGVADLDGDGTAEMVALREGYIWYGKKPFKPEISQVQWGLPGDYPLLPLDLNLDGKADYIVSRPTGGGQYLYIRLSNGTTQVIAAGQDTSIPMTGNFIGAPSFAWAQRDTGFSAIMQFGSAPPSVFPFGIAANAIIRPDGTVVQPSESGRFGSPPPPPSSGSNGSSGFFVPTSGSGDSIGAVLRCDRQLDRNDGRGGYKSNAKNSRHTLKQIFPGRLNYNIAAVYAFSNGAVFDKLHSMGFETGFREWWNGSKNISAYPDNLIIAVNRLDGIQECVTLPDPQTTYD